MATDSERMNSPKLTDQQRRAVTARGVSVALSAGAGCGKTTVLTERFLAELQPGGDVGVKGDSPIFAETKIGTVPAKLGTVPERRSRLGQIVAITFTERAAREMRDRIRRACRERLENCPEQEVGHWLGLVREMDSARISTIHSFCGSLLRSHAVEAGLDPRFRVLDAAQAATLLFELTDDVLRTRLGDRDEATLVLVTRYSFDRLRDMIAELLAARQDIDWTLWQRETPEGLVARWQDFWRRDTLPRLLRQIAESADAKTLLDLAMRVSARPSRDARAMQFVAGAASAALWCRRLACYGNSYSRSRQDACSTRTTGGDPRECQSAGRRHEKALGE